MIAPTFRTAASSGDRMDQTGALVHRSSAVIPKTLCRHSSSMEPARPTRRLKPSTGVSSGWLPNSFGHFPPEPANAAVRWRCAPGSRRSGKRRVLRQLAAVLSPLLLVFVLLGGCQDRSSAEPSAQGPAAQQPVESAVPLHTGDLTRIRDLGILRILVHLGDRRHLARDDHAESPHIRQLERFARQQGLEPRIVAVAEYAQLIPALLQGRGDVIAANLTALPERKQQVNFTRALDTTQEYIVTRRSDPLDGRSDLAGRTISVQRGTSFALTARELQARHPRLRVENTDPALDMEALLDQIAQGSIDLAIADGNYLETISHYRSDVKAAFPVSVERDIAWAVRPGAINLLGELNRFISAEKKRLPTPARSTADLDTMLQRGTLRVAMANTPASYFIWRGQLFGFEYELARHFAEQHGLELHVVTIDDYSRVYDLLREGRVDIVAAFLTPTPWAAGINIAYSRPYHYSSEVLVTRPDSTVATLDELDTRTIAVRKSSSYWQTLQDLISSGTILRVKAAPETLTTDQLIERVGRGEIDLTVADSHIVGLEMRWRRDITASLSLTGLRPHSWAVRENNPGLLRAINQFLLPQDENAPHRRAIERYFATPVPVPTLRAGVGQELATGALSRYDTAIQRYAALYDFDWRLIAAQVACESGFDPAYTSWTGAQGLLQILPQTALALGFDTALEPDIGLHAGVKYMALLRQQIGGPVDSEQGLWFTLAAYNAGMGHLLDARALARRQGMDPNQWFDHVEDAMLLLSHPRYARRARFGVVKGIEPVNYLHCVRQQYREYIETATAERGTTGG